MSSTSNFHGLLARGMPTTAPAFLPILGFAIIAGSVFCLIASAVAISGLGVYVSGAAGFVIFDAIFTWIVVGGSMAVAKWAPNMYFRIVVLVLWVKALIFWLSAWAWSASVAGLWLRYSCDDSIYCDTWWRRFGAGMAASAALGAVVWVLMIVYFVFWIKACMADPEGLVVASHAAELGQVKQEPVATVTPVQQEPYGQPQQYPPQQYPPQQYPQDQAYSH